MTNQVSEPAKSPWIHSPVFDILFIANVSWVLLMIPAIIHAGSGTVDFWQVYYLVMPHRWMTLFLVATDRDRRDNHGRLLFSIVLGLAVIVGGSYWSSGAFLCLGFIDYIWNAWHFSSQHTGILRIYSRKTDLGNEWLERHGLRAFIVYAILRTAGGMVWSTSQLSYAMPLLHWLDFAILAIPLLILFIHWKSWQKSHLAKSVYLMSMLTLYIGYLVAGHFELDAWILCFATAASLFHAIEYLAIVSHYALRRQQIGSADIIRELGKRWGLVLSIFLVGLGSFGWWITTLSAELQMIWQGVNLWAAYTHYAFDGIIWKLRKPTTAKALGA